jgi:hypothetical protein
MSHRSNTRRADWIAKTLLAAANASGERSSLSNLLLFHLSEQHIRGAPASVGTFFSAAPPLPQPLEIILLSQF